MADADERLADLCYEGEALVSEFPVGDGRVGVTSHRVLVLDPRGDGRRFRAIHRPNVTDVAVRTVSGTDEVRRALQAGIVAVVLLLGGATIDLGGLVRPVEAPPGTGMGGVIELVSAAIGVLALVDDALLVGGLLALAAALFSAGQFLRGRRRYLQIGVAGADPVRVPIRSTAEANRTAEGIERALASEATGEAVKPV